MGIQKKNGKCPIQLRIRRQHDDKTAVQKMLAGVMTNWCSDKIGMANLNPKSDYTRQDAMEGKYVHLGAASIQTYSGSECMEKFYVTVRCLWKV